MGHTLIHGDVNEVLTSEYLFPDNSFDACFCDPPYLLSFMGKAFDRQHKREAGFNEGQRMQAWHERWARSVYRVLKPGAFLLAFGGTRTVHRLASALEDVGFEIRDTLCWLYGQGFPKSLDISKAIDKHTGEERVITRAASRPDLNRPTHIDMDPRGSSERERRDIPATEQSALWSGYGTALKPAMEPLVLAMKPTAGTFAENAIEWGCGGLNIDGCRIGWQSASDRAAQARLVGFKGVEGKPSNSLSGGLDGSLNTVSEENIAGHSVGRWPSNLLFSHHPSCIPLGTKLVAPAGGDIRPNSPGSGPRSNKIYGEDKSDRGEWKGYKGEDGMEEVESWECHPLCPVGMLDAQSRSGAASRFFYCAKTSPSERDLNLPPGTNRHPTLKPITLCTYLSRLLLPPPRASSPRSILIPFAGAGSEMIGALQAGWDDVLGIEMEEESVEWARARIGSVADVPR